MIEHLPDPNVLFEAAKAVLTPDGIVVCFCPNGDVSLENIYGQDRYDKLRGKVHPLLITPRFLLWLAQRHGFDATVYSSPYDGDEIRNRKQAADLRGTELLLIAHRE